MSDHFESSLAWVLAQEGGYAELKNDEVTNLGVKKSTWQEWTRSKTPITNEQMRRLTLADVAPLYRKNYYDGALCNQFNYPFSLAVFDLAVNSGVGRALALLSHLTGVSTDAAMRKQMVERINGVENIAKTTDDFLNQRKDYLRICRNYNLYGKGWEARVERLRTHIKDCLAHPERENAT